jgi:hypothetical protein
MELGVGEAGLVAAGRVPEPGCEPDRRRHPRFEIDAQAILLLVGHGGSVQGRITELSQEGCRLRVRQRFSADAQLRVEVSFRINGMTFRLGGTTQWNDGWNLMGIRFAGVPAWRAADLAEVIGEVQAEGLARAEKRAVAEGAKLTRGDDAASSCLTAEALPGSAIPPKPISEPSQFRASIHAVPDQIAVRAVKGEPGRLAEHEAGRPERRAQPRHTVDTFASIILVHSGSRLSGWILDLSLGGCRIRTDSRFPVGIYTRVETEFRVEGLPFRLAGVVQAIYDRKLVGIQFLDVSERKNAQLEQLIAEIDARDANGKPAESVRLPAVTAPAAQGNTSPPPA